MNCLRILQISLLADERLVSTDAHLLFYESFDSQERDEQLLRIR